MIRCLLTLLALTLSSPIALAHKPSDSYLAITEASAGDFDVQWDIALRDLDHAIGLDGDGDGDLTWGEVRAREVAINAYAGSRLTLENEGQACPLEPVTTSIDEHSDGVYAALRFRSTCALPVERLAVDYRLLFDLDRQHRGVFSLNAGGRTATFVFSPDRPSTTFDVRPGDAAASAFGIASFSSFFVDGIGHMLGGFDHGLFLLVLLLPALSGRSGSYFTTLIDVAKILTAFTLGHGVSLAAASFGYVALPSRLVEIAIAVSIALAAIDNIRPIFGARRWLIALGFGLIHGLGFATALGPLDLQPGALALALLAFNLGLEAAQIMIAALLLPLSWLLTNRQAAASLGLKSGSIMAIAVSAALVADRALDLRMMPF